MNWVVLAVTRSHGSPATIDSIGRFPAQNDMLGWCQDMGIGTAILLMVMGIVYLLYGWSIYKALITLNAAILGAYIGAIMGQRAGGYVLAGGFLGVLLSAGTAWPLMKWAVAIMGGMCGALVGASIWLLVGLDGHFAWAGAMTGLVGFGLFSFIVFRGSLITYMSIQGSLMFIMGLLGLALKWQEISPSVAHNMSSQPMVLPIAVLVPTVIGLIYQQTHAPAGGGGGAPKPAEKK